MGDRAVITASKDINIQNSNDIGVYLHWNGDINSMTAFLNYCNMKYKNNHNSTVRGAPLSAVKQYIESQKTSQGRAK